MNIQVIPANINDLEEILDLQKRCYLSEAEIYNDFTIAPLTQDLQSIIKEFEYSIILIGVYENKIIASIRGYEKENTCYIGKVIVEPAFQNVGIGKKLLVAMEKQFDFCKRFELFTGDKSLKNLHFYQSVGYKQFKREVVTEHFSFVFLEKLKI